jgi:hypothetical protein
MFYKYNIFNFKAVNTVFFKLSHRDLINIVWAYDDLFEKWMQKTPRQWCEEIMFDCLKETKLETLKVYPFFMTLGHLKYIFYQGLCRVGFFDTQWIFFKLGSLTANIIPKILRNKIYATLNAFMKIGQKK